MNPKLDVLICTFGESGIRRAAEMTLSQLEGVRYVISWQTAGADPRDIPASLQRADILVAPTSTVGSSNNRNHSISVSTADYCLIADDDLKYTPEQLQAVINTLDSNPDVDVANFQYSGDDNKEYPHEEVNLTHCWPKNFHSVSFEVAFRRKSIAGKIFYNPYFGINSEKLCCGDDSIFMVDCCRAGLNCRFFPITITHHAGQTSGYRQVTDPRTAMTFGASIRYIYGWKGFPRVPLTVWRRWRSGQSKFWWGLRHTLRGFLYKVPQGAK